MVAQYLFCDTYFRSVKVSTISLGCYHSLMHGILQFNISYEDGTYTADGVNAPIVTAGLTFEELASNIRDAVSLFFHGEHPEVLGFTSSPSILTSFELPTISYGAQA